MIGGCNGYAGMNAEEGKESGGGGGGGGRTTERPSMGEDGTDCGRCGTFEEE